MMMDVSEALKHLGASRVIWIDDRFNDTPAQLARLLTNNLEIAQACQFETLQETLSTYEYNAEEALQQLTQILSDFSDEKREDIRNTFFKKESEKGSFATNELSVEAMSNACKVLGVSKGDRWTFEQADQGLDLLCKEGDAQTSYIVDLNESGGSSTRGLDILTMLWKGNSKGTAFILTHETDVNGEASKEQELLETLQKSGDIDGLGLPLCVIAKERLSEAAENGEGLAEALRIGIKRAGLRKSMFQVLNRARDTLRESIDTAALKLLSVAPEQLEEHVFERGYKEGVSELHVVERAITAHIGREARAFFGGDEDVQASVQRLRAMRGIKLNKPPSLPGQHLADFREAEVWEPDDLLNKALTPIACGDVFSVDSEEKSTNSSKQRFILLGQPCDISLRPDKNGRNQDTAFFIPLKVKNPSTKPDVKEPLLPFTLRGEQWACDFRNASVVNLSILDLASFRIDGRVRVDDGHQAPEGLLVAQQKIYNDRTKTVTDALSNPELRPGNGQLLSSLQLTFATSGAFKYIFSPQFEDSSSITIHKTQKSLPKRATWRLRRLGRVRMPYAAALLDLYTSVMSRQAYDVDFLLPGGVFAQGATKAELASTTEPAGDMQTIDGVL